MKLSPQTKKILVFVGLYFVTFLLMISIAFLEPKKMDDFPFLRLFIITFATILLIKYFIYMVVSPWYDTKLAIQRNLEKEEKLHVKRPLVSVIVPAWNEEVGLIKTVKTILANTYPNFEIIIINDGSTDSSDILMRKFMKQYRAQKAFGNKKKANIVYKYKQNGGKGHALNYGIGLSHGEIIISIDADCVLLPTTIGNFVRHFNDQEVMAVVGNVKIGNQKSLLETLQYLEFLFSFYFKKADSLLNTIYIIGGAAGAFRSSVFKKIGLYNSQNITEDIELSFRIQKAGMKIAYASDAIVFTEAATTFSGLAAQRLRWKRGRFQTFFEHRDLFYSDKKIHNKILTWLVLPLAIFGDIQLFFEVFFIAFLYLYSFVSHDFSSFLSGIIVVSTIFFVLIWDDKTMEKKDLTTLYLLAPIGWLLFYVTSVIEHRALIKSIYLMLRGEKLIWQKWNRVGISEKK